jgi:hypothetical protein
VHITDTVKATDPQAAAAVGGTVALGDVFDLLRSKKEKSEEKRI